MLSCLKRRLLLALLVVVSPAGLQDALAADWSIIPSVDLRTEFDSNLNFSYGTRLKDYILSLAPATNFNYSTERSFLQGHVGFKGFHFISRSNLDTVDQSYQINSRYQLLPRLGMGLNASYISDSTMQQEYLESGLTLGRTGRQSVRMAPNLNYAIAERLTASLGYDFHQVNYDNPRLRNFLTHAARVSPEYRFKNEKTTLAWVLSLKYNKYLQNNDRYETLGSYLSLTHKFSETWHVSASAGINFNWMKYRTVVFGLNYFPTTLPDGSVINYPLFVQTPKAQKYSSQSPFFNLSITKKWQKVDMSAGYIQDESASGVGTLYQSKRVRASVGYDLTALLSLNLVGSYYHSSSSQKQSGSKETNLSLNPSLRYQLTEKLNLTSGYSFGWRENEVSDKTAHRHNVWLTLNYTYPWHY